MVHNFMLLSAPDRAVSSSVTSDEYILGLFERDGFVLQSAVFRFPAALDGEIMKCTPWSDAAAQARERALSYR